VILGGHDPFDGPIVPSATSLYGPRGAWLSDADGSLWVSDTGHHRILVWRARPEADRAPADLVLGAPDFATEGRNAGRDEASASTLNMPCGLSAWPGVGGAGLVVADSWNNRVLVWRTRPTRSGQPADLVLGQADFNGQSPNRGRDAAGADTMHWPFQALVHEGRLYVADAGNRRVLVWRKLPETSGAPADFALGQPSIDERSDNGGGDTDARTMRWPHDLAVVAGQLAVADAGNNRVLLFAPLPDRENVAATLVLGQAGFGLVDHNQGTYNPTARALNMPYGIDAHDGALLVADTANSRLLGFAAPLLSGAPAAALSGQHAFTKKGDNRWGETVRDSLCWPYGLKVHGRTALVADTGNHRVLLWDLA
jgi:hypothetical protein